MFTIYAATNPDKTEQVIECVDEQIRHLLNAGINDAEIIRCKNQLKGNYILGLDSTSSRMSSIGKSKIITGTVYSPEETLKQIDEINITDLMEIAALIFSFDNRAITILGSTKTEPSLISKIKL
jgi:predicted Zn-dependent peptidase